MKKLIIILLLMIGGFWSCSIKLPQPSETKLVTAHLCFTSIQLSSELSDADLVELARRYRVISDAKTCFTTEQMTRLRQIRPKIRIIRYRNFAAVIDSSRAEWVLKYHPDWAMRDADGNPLRLLLNPTGLMIRPGSYGWMSYLVQRVSQDMADGYDGTMADCVTMCRRLRENFTGINTDTGRPYTTEEYRHHQLELVEAVKSAIGERSLILNSVQRGLFYFWEEPYPFLNAADGVVAEGFRGESHWSLEHHLSEASWLANVKMMLDIQSRDKAVVVIIKIDKKVADQCTPQELKKCEKFWYCTFLLGLQDSAYYVASVGDRNTQKRTRLFYGHHEKNLGNPVGEYSKEGNYYRREFENGRVTIDIDKHIGEIIEYHRSSSS